MKEQTKIRKKNITTREVVGFLKILKPIFSLGILGLREEKLRKFLMSPRIEKSII